MYQRAEDPNHEVMQHPDPTPITTEPQPIRSGGLSTADLAGTTPSRQERDSDLPERFIITPIDSQRTQTRPPEGSPPAEAHQSDEYPSLFKSDESERFRSRWTDVQAGFVDEPRQAVERADGLVAETIKRLAEGFAEERSQLETQWSRGEDVSTEDLRLALRRYRSFFDRLLSV
jgi:hypothetical protein